ncbi:MAG: hypothetical protein GEEBNDBF_02034 [bacterium]|nr:hypothetical protein [bacterium]
MREIRTHLEIPAPPSAVWAVLTDFPSFARWNPLIPHLEGEPAVNAVLSMMVKTPEGKTMTFRPRVLVCRENKELRWIGTFLMAAIFAGEHFFELEPASQGRITRLTHGEIFTGLVPDYFSSGAFYEGVEAGFKKMNQALQDEVVSRGFPEVVPEALPSGQTRLGAILR